MARSALFHLLAALSMATAAPATTVDYLLDPAASSVTFETDFGPDLITGTIPGKTPPSA